MNDPKIPPASDVADDAPASDESHGAETTDKGQTEKKRLDPTRYGDWEKDGRCIDF